MTFFLDYQGPKEAAERWSSARAEAAAIMRDIPATFAANVPRDPLEAHLAALIFAAATVHITAGLNGLTVRHPALAGTSAYQTTERLISWETLLPASDFGVSGRTELALADRFRVLAELCSARAEWAKNK